MIASYNGYGRKNSLCKQTDLLSYPKSRDAIASKKSDNWQPTDPKPLESDKDQFLMVDEPF